MPKDPYRDSPAKTSSYAKKLPVLGTLCVILASYADDRGLELAPYPSRAVSAGQVHELIATDEVGAGPGKVVNRIAYLGFAEFATGGVILHGDDLYVGDKRIGQLAGYDFTHMPNHMNIVISVDRLQSGSDLNLELGTPVRFVMSERPSV